MSNLNLIGLASNISRGYEIARAGKHTIKIVLPKNSHIPLQDISIFSEFYGIDTAPINPDIIMELAYDPADLVRILNDNRFETLEDINKRADLVLSTHDNIDTNLCKSSKALLKTACERLEFGVNDVIKILAVSETIAKLSKSETIKVEHIAEAIQYRSVQY